MSLVSYDILFCIHIRLPVKSLLRFQSVSKLWNTIISDHKFKKAHCDQSRALGNLKFLLHKRRNPHTDEAYDIDFVELKNPKVVIEKQLLPLTKSHIICSHDGLVLLQTHKTCDTFVLWNPSTRQHKNFVCPYVRNSSRVNPNACGLCYDSTTDDYKIIVIFRLFYVVCSANNNFWTIKITLPILEQILENERINYWSHEFSNHGIAEGVSTSEGCVYWSLDSPVTQRRSEKKLLSQHVSKISIIIRFNAKSDDLEAGFPIPDFIGEKELFRLSTLNGCLSLYGGKKDETNVWIMEQDEWKWFVKIRWVTPCVRSTKLLCCTKDGELIFHGRGKHSISIFNPRKQTLAITTYRPLDYLSDCVFRLMEPPCLDSLCFPRLNTHAQDEAL